MLDPRTVLTPGSSFERNKEVFQLLKISYVNFGLRSYKVELNKTETNLEAEEASAKANAEDEAEAASKEYSHAKSAAKAAISAEESAEAEPDGGGVGGWELLLVAMLSCLLFV